MMSTDYNEEAARTKFLRKHFPIIHIQGNLTKHFSRAALVLALRNEPLESGYLDPYKSECTDQCPPCFTGLKKIAVTQNE